METKVLELQYSAAQAFPSFSFPSPAPFSSGRVLSPILANTLRLLPLHSQAPPPRPDGPAPTWTKLTTCGGNGGGKEDARGAAASESGSAFSAAPGGEEVDFRLPADWKNLLKTACLAGAGPAAAAPPAAGFRRDIAGPGVTAQGQARAGSANPRPQVPGVCGREHVATLRCAGAGGGAGAGSRLHKSGRGAWWPLFGATLDRESRCRERARKCLLPLSWFVRSIASSPCRRIWASARTGTCRGPHSGTCWAGEGWVCGVRSWRKMPLTRVPGRGRAGPTGSGRMGPGLRHELTGPGPGPPSVSGTGRPSY